MKKEKGIALNTLILIIVAILVLGGVVTFFAVKGNDNDRDKDKEKVESVDKDLEKEDDEEKVDEEETAEEKNFWVNNYKSWGEQKETLRLKLFDGKFTAPIDLKSADSFIKEVSYYPNGHGKVKATTIAEVLNSTTMIDSSTSVWLDYGELNDVGTYNDSISLTLENFNETDMSMKDCFSNNWWCISSLSVQDGLGITLEEGTYDASEQEITLLNKVISKLGGPKHIYIYLNWDESITYGLYYEYSDFAIEISVLEISIENVHRCSISEVRYAPKEYWEKAMEDKRESYEDFEVMK